MNSIQPYLNIIENHRKSKSLYWKILISIKDTIWFFQDIIRSFPFHRYWDAIRYFFRNKNNKQFLYDEINSPQDKQYSISFCITCMNRLNHLKKTLPQNLKDNADYKNLQFVILDYSSTEKIENWIIENFNDEFKSGKIKIIREDGNQYFHMARAKNISHYFADGEIVCNIDADNYTGKDFARYLNYIANRNDSFVSARKPVRFDLDTMELLNSKDRLGLYSAGSDSGGRIAVLKKDFVKLGGYNEAFSNWGQDDNDFFLRCLKDDFNYEIIPKYFFGSIRHSNSLRASNMSVKNLKKTDIEYEDLMKDSLRKNIISIPNDFNYPNVIVINEDYKAPFENQVNSGLQAEDLQISNTSDGVSSSNIVYMFLAYKNPKVLRQCILKLNDQNASFVIHLDKKADIEKYQKEFALDWNNIYFIEDRVNIMWGGYSMITATLNLIKYAKGLEKNFDSFCLLSEQHLPIVDRKEIISFVSNKKYSGAMKIIHEFDSKEREDEFIDRTKYYWNIDNDTNISFDDIQTQQKNNVNRRDGLKFNLFKGSQWWCLSSDVIDFILNYIENNSDFVELMKYSSIPDESFFHSIVMSSPYKDKIQNFNFTYLNWVEVPRPKGCEPKVLGFKDYYHIKESGKLFARKFEYEKSFYLTLKLNSKFH